MKGAVTAVSRTRALMSFHDPVPGDAFASDWADDHWQAEYRRILACPAGDTGPARVRRFSRVGLPLLAGVTAGVVLIAAMIAGGAGGRQGRNVPAAGQPAMTGRPAMLRYTLTGVRSPVTAVDLPPARAVLLHLAQVAAAQRPVPKPAGADVSYTRAREWASTMFITARGPVARPLIMGPVQTWTAPDGAVMSVDCAAETACRPYDHLMIPAGQRIFMGAGPLASTLPADPVALRARLLAQAVDRYPEAGTQKIIRTIIYGLGMQVLTPQQEASLWRALAGLSDIRYMGTVRDRDGRPGVAVEYLGSSWIRNDYRYVLIISPDTGRLLGEEEIQMPVHMVGNRGQVRPGGSGPVVAQYLVFISQGWAARLGGPVR